MKSSFIIVVVFCVDDSGCESWWLSQTLHRTRQGEVHLTSGPADWDVSVWMDVNGLFCVHMNRGRYLLWEGSFAVEITLLWCCFLEEFRLLKFTSCLWMNVCRDSWLLCSRSAGGSRNTGLLPHTHRSVVHSEVGVLALQWKEDEESSETSCFLLSMLVHVRVCVCVCVCFQIKDTRRKKKKRFRLTSATRSRETPPARNTESVTEMNNRQRRKNNRDSEEEEFMSKTSWLKKNFEHQTSSEKLLCELSSSSYSLTKLRFSEAANEVLLLLVFLL